MSILRRQYRLWLPAVMLVAEPNQLYMKTTRVLALDMVLPVKLVPGEEEQMA